MKAKRTRPRLLPDENASHRLVSACRQLVDDFPLVHIAAWQDGSWLGLDDVALLIGPTRRPVGRVLCRWQVEEDLRDGGNCRHALRRAERPRWKLGRGRDDRVSAMYHGAPDQRIMVAPYTVERGSFRAEEPRLWSEGRFAVRPRQRSFDLHPNGDRFAIAAAPDATAARQDKVVFIFNFFDELERLAPTK